MADLLAEVQTALVTWAQSAQSQGWLPATANERVRDLETQTPSKLFAAGDRPLVVALFGGTGAGKSSLLNRLAQSDIAHASATRPTSREVTMYVHQSVTVEHLPDDFPMANLRTSIHQRELWRDVVWIDMPDFDSVETRNREQVLQWLPHVDVVLYVVNPERYRDDEGWQLLRRHGRRHAWMFAMNHWDRGDPAQLDDFRRLLVEAGLPDAPVFRTDARPRPPEPDDAVTPSRVEDDFLELETAIRSLADRQLIRELESRGVFKRLEALRELGRELHAELGEQRALEALPDTWSRRWEQEAGAMADASKWRVQQLAPQESRAMSYSTSWMARLPKALRPALADDTHSAGPATTMTRESEPESAALIDRAMLGRIETGIDRFLQTAVEDGCLPATVARRCAEQAARDLASDLPQRVNSELHRSLAAPGTPWQRRLVASLGWLAGLLPVAACIWVAFRVVEGFGRGASDPDAYLGGDFAINAILLVSLAWGVPSLLAWRLKPSRMRAAARGLNRGLHRALAHVGDRTDIALQGIIEERRTLEREYRAIWTAAEQQDSAQLPEALRRLLVLDPVI